VLTGSGSGSRSTRAGATFQRTRPTWSSWLPPAPLLPDRLDRLDRIRDLHAQWGDHAPEDADGYLDLWETLGRLLDGEPG
jgi:hypothetical protein